MTNLIEDPLIKQGVLIASSALGGAATGIGFGETTGQKLKNAAIGVAAFGLIPSAIDMSSSIIDQDWKSTATMVAGGLDDSATLTAAGIRMAASLRPKK